MERSRFWALIDRARQEAIDDASFDLTRSQARRLRQSLELLAPEQIVAFDQHFHELLHQAYSWKLWAAASIISGGCTDDQFHDFCCWLIAQGQATFDSAVADPATLLGKIHGSIDGDPMNYVADEAYESVTGSELPFPDVPPPADPAGTPWREEDLPGMFPALWAAYRAPTNA